MLFLKIRLGDCHRCSADILFYLLLLWLSFMRCTIGVAAILRSNSAIYTHCTLGDTRGVWQDVPSLVRDAANIAIVQAVTD